MSQLDELTLKIYEDITKDVLEEFDSRQENIEIYYPYFETIRKLKAKQNTPNVDLLGVFMAMLSFLLYEGKLNSKKIRHKDICQFIQYFIQKITDEKLEEEEVKNITNLVLDEAQNGGINFLYSYYSFQKQRNKEKHIKYIEIKEGEDGNYYYYMTPQGVDFYLKTKEFPDAAQITINLLLFRKQIEKGSFDYAYQTVKRLNIEVKKKIDQKEDIIEGLMYGGKEAVERYYNYHKEVNSQFAEENELFQETMEIIQNLYTDYLQKENLEKLNSKEKNTIKIIRQIEKELNKAIDAHTRLLKEATNIPVKYDEIIKIRMKSAFSEKFGFEREFEKLIRKTDNPDNLKYFVMPFLLPKTLKSFNPMKAFEPQKLAREEKEAETEKQEEKKEYKNIDKITEERVINNHRFYFQNLLLLLKRENKTDLKQFAELIKSNYGENYLYNGDFVSFAIYLNQNKIIKRETEEIFSDLEFGVITIQNLEDELDLENGLKITNLRISGGN